MAPVVEMTRVEEEDPEGVWARRRVVVEGVAVEEVWCRVAGAKGAVNTRTNRGGALTAQHCCQICSAWKLVREVDVLFSTTTGGSNSNNAGRDKSAHPNRCGEQQGHPPPPTRPNLAPTPHHVSPIRQQ